MNEKSKLAEAQHFLARMHAEHADPKVFAKELNAFLASSRSVLQYTLKEAETKKGGKKWYVQAVASSPLFGFFKDLRDESIHSVPVKPVTKMKPARATMLNIGDDDEEILIPYEHDTTTNHHEFTGRPGEEVTDLSRQYLDALEQLVEAGVNGGWITG